MVWKRVVFSYVYDEKEYQLKGELPLSDERVSLWSEGLSLFVSCKFPVRLRRCELILGWNYEKGDRIFVHGFQSWSDSREFTLREKLLGLPEGLRFAYDGYHLDFYGDYHFYHYTNKRGVFHSHGWTLVGGGGLWHLIGSLDEASAYTIFEHHPRGDTLRIVRDVEGWELSEGAHEIVSLFHTAGTREEVYRRYSEVLGLQAPSLPKTTGWTSWYNYYTNISEEIILDNLAAFRKHRLPVDIFQIDDGYQTAVGDWLSLKPTFPHGMQFIAQAIHEAGYRAGLWLAPLICEKKSSIALQHPEWILRREDGSPVIAGFSENWNGDFYALDLDNAEVRQYLETVFHTVLHEWGFDMVKLDFLYAASIYPHGGLTRAAHMERAMEFLRKLVGEKKILACGVPIANALGKVEYSRIGCDVGLSWEDIRPARIHFRERISTIKAITTTIGRYPLHRKGFLNDPDVFILREKNHSLLWEQQRTLFCVNYWLGGLVFTSDHVGEYTPERLALYRKQFPVAEVQIGDLVHHHEVYRFRPRSAYIQAVGNVKVYQAFYTGWMELPFCRGYVVINTGKKAVRHCLPDGVFFDWVGEEYVQGEVVIPPCATRLFLHIHVGEGWTYGGSTEHLLPGSGIQELSVSGEQLVASLHPQAIGGNLHLVSLKGGKLFWKGEEVAVERHPLGWYHACVRL